MGHLILYPLFERPLLRSCKDNTKREPTLDEMHPRMSKSGKKVNKIRRRKRSFSTFADSYVNFMPMLAYKLRQT
jgi:hypothetical protein